MGDHKQLTELRARVTELEKLTSLAISDAGHLTIFEDFFGESDLALATAAYKGWYAQVAGTGTVTLQGGGPGFVTVITGATAGDAMVNFKQQYPLRLGALNSEKGELLEFRVVVSPDAAALNANHDVFAGLAADTDTNTLASVVGAHHIGVKLDGDMSIVVVGYDGTTTTAFDSGLDAVKDQGFTARFDLTDLNAVTVWIDIGDGVGFQFVTTVNLADMNAASAFEPCLLIDATAGTVDDGALMDYFKYVQRRV